jgi:cytochrome P450
VLAGREPTLEDFPKLVITEQIVRETLRLYPSIWTMGRRAMEDLTYAGQTLPKGALLVASQWLTQRDERWFSEPLEFRPQRWTAEFRGTLPRYAYFPFGGGSRSCIGENFAWMELVLIVATIAQRWRFSLTPSAAEVKPHARITIHPDRPVQMRLHRRS